jgi:hypothetical protein
MHGLEWSVRSHHILLPGVMTAVLLLNGAGSAGARGAGAYLLHRAITDTDRARTLVEVDTSHQVIGNETSTRTSWEIYDNAHNAERDHDQFSSALRGKKGTITRTHETVDVVMVHGRTYHRSSSTRVGWEVAPGYGYTDPVSGLRWVRGSQTFTFLGTLPLISQGRASGGRWHFRFRLTLKAPAHGTAYSDAWVSTRGTPYIVKYAEFANYTSGNEHVRLVRSSTLSAFNQHVTIRAHKVE